MKEKRNDAELKNRKTKRDYDYERRVSDIYFDLFFVFVAAGTFLWVIMHSIFDACIDSWKADPELNNFRYMWNILMYVIPYTIRNPPANAHNVYGMTYIRMFHI